MTESHWELEVISPFGTDTKRIWNIESAKAGYYIFATKYGYKCNLYFADGTERTLLTSNNN